MTRIPRKLKSDPIVEALFEVQFESTEISEVVVGKLASCEMWADFTSTRLPLAEMPATMRDQDPSLSRQPILQLESGGRAVKIGPRVLSYHARKPYPGWSIFEPELMQTTDHLFDCLKNVAISRLGFRYINVLTAEHFVTDSRDLNLKVELAGQTLTCPWNLNFERKHGDEHYAIVRIASKELVNSPSEGLNLLIDIDLKTPTGNMPIEQKSVQAWIKAAHDFEKYEFFTTLPDTLIDQLEEK